MSYMRVMMRHVRLMMRYMGFVMGYMRLMVWRMSGMMGYVRFVMRNMRFMVRFVMWRMSCKMGYMWFVMRYHMRILVMNIQRRFVIRLRCWCINRWRFILFSHWRFRVWRRRGRGMMRLNLVDFGWVIGLHYLMVGFFGHIHRFRGS